jgi:hypothetical protein
MVSLNTLSKAETSDASNRLSARQLKPSRPPCVARADLQFSTFVHDTARREHRLGIPMGAVAPIAQVMDLGREWYARHADPDWRKWTVREAAEIFRKVGLVGDFWEFPVTEGGF